MARIKLLSIPKVFMAHSFSMMNYENTLPKAEDKIEISYIVEGKAVNERGSSAPIIIPQNSVVINLYNEPLHICCEGEHCHHTVGFSVKFEHCGEDDPEGIELPDSITSAHKPERFLELIDNIIRIHTIYPERAAVCSGLALQLIGELSAEAREDSASPRVTGEYRYVRRAKKYIFDHITEPIIEREVARNLEITPEYLCTVFKRCEGVSLIGFINKIKLQNIKSLIETTKTSLNRAAGMYGYSDPNYVSRLFRKYYGMSLSDCIAGKNSRKYK